MNLGCAPLSSLGLPTSSWANLSNSELQNWDWCKEQHGNKNNSFKQRALAFGKCGSRNQTKNAFPQNKDMPRNFSSLKYQP